jgi:GcrA cell cycle regulator
MMSWTEERVSRLTKLWADGLSASQVAADLGGVTRNAVIGKVHRLGLSGRAKPAASAASRTKRQARSTSYAARTTRAAPRSRGATALKLDAEVEVRFMPKPVEDVVIPISRKLTLMQLSEKTCKWPTGDPQRPDFSFCGHNSKETTPYCEFHSKLAFQPASDRRKRRR